MKTIGVLGAGTWGMALSRVLSNNGNKVTVWSALPQEIDALCTARKHPNLPGMEIPEEIAFTKDIQQVCQQKDILLFAVPSPFVRSTARQAAPYIAQGQIIVDVAKGIEADTLYTMTQIIGEEMQASGVKLVALSGPTHAEEVAKDLPTTIVASCEDIGVAKQVQAIFDDTCMRVYTNTDVKGVELCGAMKNVIALASGIAAGLGYGDNTKAALITRGVTEIARLGTAMGCSAETFYGLTGIGDLIVTATSMHSRNNRCGMLIGQGIAVEEAIKQVGMVVEGINAIPAAMRLKERYNVELPIMESVHAVVAGKISPEEAVRELMDRKRGSE